MSLLQTYHTNGSLLAGHVNHSVFGVEHSTGALGHGINVAVGCAMGLRSRGYSDCPVLVLLGDGELQEGSVWEAMMLAAHLKLTNLIALVDNNRISSITSTEKVINMRPLTSRFEGFGIGAVEVNGHDVTEIMAAISAVRNSDAPSVIICNTVKGRDVPFAEEQPIWHYKSLTDEQFEEAIAYLDQLESTA